MKRLIRMIVILAVLDILGLGALWFEYSTILAKQDEEMALVKDIVDEKQKGAEFTTTQKVVTQAQKESGALSKYFYDPGDESQIRLVATMEALGTSTSHALVETTSFVLVGGAMPGFHGEFALKGTWREVYHLLRLMETFPAHLIINRFSVTTLDKKNATTAVWDGGMSIDLIGLKNP
jgi:hypothetical protein